MGSLNRIACAGDMLLLSPSPFGLQTLLNTCDKFAKDHGIVYNTKKIVRMLFLPKMFKNMFAQRFALCGATLNYVSEYKFKYLGFCMSDDASDNHGNPA